MVFSTEGMIQIMPLAINVILAAFRHVSSEWVVFKVSYKRLITTHVSTNNFCFSIAFLKFLLPY